MASSTKHEDEIVSVLVSDRTNPELAPADIWMRTIFATVFFVLMGILLSVFLNDAPFTWAYPYIGLAAGYFVRPVAILGRRLRRDFRNVTDIKLSRSTANRIARLQNSLYFDEKGVIDLRTIPEFDSLMEESGEHVINANIVLSFYQMSIEWEPVSEVSRWDSSLASTFRKYNLGKK